MNPALQWRFDKSPITVDQMAQIESEAGVLFPLEYKMLMLEHHGGRPQPNGFDTDRTKGRKVKSFLPILPEYKINLLDLKKWLPLPDRLIPFAGDPAGNYVCFDYKKGMTHPEIVLWLHETEETEWISPSFETFLSMLY